MKHIFNLNRIEQADGLTQYYKEFLQLRSLSPQAIAVIKAKLIEWQRLITS